MTGENSWYENDAHTVPDTNYYRNKSGENNDLDNDVLGGGIS